MSNYLSSEYRITNPVSAVDLQVVDNTLSTLQKKYDTNTALIEQTLAYYDENLKGLRESDNQYIAEKLKRVKSTIDEYKKKNVNLAYNYNRDSIMSAVKETLNDPIVKDAITSRQNYMQYNSQLEKIKEKNPEKVNDANYAYGLYQGGYYDYMQGKTKTLGSMQYTPFEDITEENLKQLKTIKDLKGKKFVEMEDPTNPGRIIRREIDGLEDTEIQQYMGGLMSSQALKQIEINAWYKNGAQNIEKNREPILNQYKAYNDKQISNYTQNMEYYQSVEKSSKPESEKEKARLALKTLQSNIDSLKNIDYSKLSTTSVVADLEKRNYINSISQMAKAEWSTEFKKNEVYYADQDLDIKRQKLELDKAELALKFRKEGLDSNGNLISAVDSGAISQTPADTQLQEKLEAESAQTFTTEKDHNEAYKGLLDEAKNILTNASSADEDVLKKSLEKRGVIVTANGSFAFKDAESIKNYSLANTVYEVFKQEGKSTPKLTSNYEIKQETSKALLQGRKEGYLEVFSKDSDKYVNSFLNGLEENRDTFSIMSDVRNSGFSVEDRRGREVLIKKAEDFIKNAGGQKNIVNYLKSNPDKLAEFSNLNKILNSMPNLSLDINVSSKSDLEKDAEQYIEKALKKRTEGTSFSAYNVFNVVDDKLRENVLRQVQTGVGSGVMNVSSGKAIETTRSFDPKLNLSIRKYGDDIYIEQSQVGNKTEGTVQLRYVVNKASTMYKQLSEYVQLEKPSAKQYFEAGKNFSDRDVKLKYPDYQNGADFENYQFKINRELEPFVDKNVFFSVVNGNAGMLSAKDGVDKTIDFYRDTLKMNSQEVEVLRQNIETNLPFYKATVESKRNEKTDRFEFYLSVADTRNGGKNIPSLDVSLGTDKLDYGFYHSLENYPQVFILNRLLRDVVNTARAGKSIQENINKAFPK